MFAQESCLAGRGRGRGLRQTQLRILGPLSQKCIFTTVRQTSKIMDIISDIHKPENAYSVFLQNETPPQPPPSPPPPPEAASRRRCFSANPRPVVRAIKSKSGP
jgi:hypothetical protein